MKTAAVYLDHAATTPCADDVITAMMPFWAENFGNAAAQGIEGRRAAEAVRAARASVAALIGAAAEGITFTSGATEANALALLGFAAAHAGGDRRDILISAAEHDSILALVPQLRAMGFDIKIIPVTSSGQVTVEALDALLSPRCLLASVIAAGHETGILQDIPALAARTHAAGAVFHTDAVQAAGKIPVNAAAWGVDMLTLSAHKIYGPQGIGALYVRPAPPLALAPLWGGIGGQPLRAGTVPLALAAGFGAACRLAQARLAQRYDSAHACRAAVLKGLRTRGVRFEVNGADTDARQLPHILSLHIRGVDAADMMTDLAGRVSLSSGSACRSAAGKTSAVLAAMGQDALRASQTLRLSFGDLASPDDAARAAEYIADYALAVAA